MTERRVKVAGNPLWWGAGGQTHRSGRGCEIERVRGKEEVHGDLEPEGLS